jgi:glycosyltransferase involved in cell wall biosynthesis
MTARRVLHVLLSLDAGGLERVALNLALEGHRAGRSAGLVCLERPGTLAPEAGAAGLPVTSLDKPAGLTPGILPRLARVIREARPDVIHTHQIGALFYAGPVSSVPIVHTEHGKADGDCLRRRVLGRLASRHASRFVCVSRDIADEVMRRRVAPRRRLCVIPNGIATDRPVDEEARHLVRSELGIPDKAPVVGTVARLDEIKRLDLLIHAVHRLRGTRSDLQLLILGDGPERLALTRLADGLGLAGVAHFPGYKSDPCRYLAAMDAFAITSRSEGMPLAVLEAWSAGLPVVAVRVGGLPEFLDDGVNGVFATSADPEGVAAALAAVIDDPGRARRLGAAGRQTVSTMFSMQRMAADYDHVYESVLEDSAR